MDTLYRITTNGRLWRVEELVKFHGVCGGEQTIQWKPFGPPVESREAAVERINWHTGDGWDEPYPEDRKSAKERLQ